MPLDVAERCIDIVGSLLLPVLLPGLDLVPLCIPISRLDIVTGGGDQAGATDGDGNPDDSFLFLIRAILQIEVDHNFLPLKLRT